MVRCFVVVGCIAAAVSANPTGESLSLLQVGAHRPVHVHTTETEPRNLISTDLCDCAPPCICKDGRAKVGVAFDTMDISATSFNKTSKSGDLSDMKDFIKALILQSGGKILNEYGISVLAPYYNGDLAHGTLDELKTDLTNPEWASYWALPGQKMPVAIEESKQEVPLQKKKKMHKKAATTAAPESEKPAEQTASEPQPSDQPEVLASQDVPDVQPSAVEQQPSQPEAAPENTVPTLSPDVTLDQAGYASVAAMKDTVMMSEFIKRVVSKEGGTLKDEKPLQWFAKYHSGEKSTQNFKLLDAQLRKSDWIEGMPAPENPQAPSAMPAPENPQAPSA